MIKIAAMPAVVVWGGIAGGDIDQTQFGVDRQVGPGVGRALLIALIRSDTCSRRTVAVLFSYGGV